jgi:cardiolipin synthase
MIPFIVWLYCFRHDYPFATLVVILSGLTDVVDGFIARRFNMVSDFGKALDPIADKLTQIAVLFCLVTKFTYMLFPLAFLVLKELFSGIVVLIQIKKTRAVHGAVWHGKLNTVLLYAMMIVHILWYDIPPVVSNIFILVCTGAMLMSAILYGVQNIGRIVKSGLRSEENKNNI